MKPEKSIQQGDRKRKFPRRSKRYGPDFKLQVVKKFVEESIPVSVIRQECGLSGGTVGRWVRDYRREGEAGLVTHYRGKGRSLPTPVKQKIVELKETNPLIGIKRISQVLKRAFFLSASPETVRKTLHESSLITSPPKKRQRNITRPLFRAISSEPALADRHLYVPSWRPPCYPIGPSTITLPYNGPELFRSRRAERYRGVRRAASEYNPPKEMLWTMGGSTRAGTGRAAFEAELKKDKIHHQIAAHHPMTLGKIERFWKPSTWSSVGPVRERGCGGTNPAVGEVLQSQAAAPGDRRSVSRRPVF
jgi:transposase